MKTLTRLAKISLNKEKELNLPQVPGVYVFWDKKTPIYIGKAKNLKNRVMSYFASDLETKTRKMISEAIALSYIKVDSELESLLLEANLIRKNQPKYNSISKDDKHPLYIRITGETYPRVITARKIEEKERNIDFFGPFPSSRSVYSVLRMLRRIFPYSDHKLAKRACLYNHIGLCNPCPNEIEKIKDEKVRAILRKKYLKNISMIRLVLLRKINYVFKILNKEMQRYSKEQKFEEAAYVRDKINHLSYITQPILPTEFFLENPNLYEDIRNKEIKELRNLLVKHIKIPKRLSRIECFDIAHLAGTSPAASMVTFINGETEKTFYRHFRIRGAKKMDDISALREVAKRRIKYLETWGKPDLIIVDGGRGQVSTFYGAFKEYKIAVIGLAKQFEKIIFENGKELNPKGDALNLVQRIRDEAHRFARRYHHKLIVRSLFS